VKLLEGRKEERIKVRNKEKNKGMKFLSLDKDMQELRSHVDHPKPKVFLH